MGFWSGGILVRRDFGQEEFWSGGILVLEGFLRRDFGWRENGILPYLIISLLYFLVRKSVPALNAYVYRHCCFTKVI